MRPLVAVVWIVLATVLCRRRLRPARGPAARTVTIHAPTRYRSAGPLRKVSHTYTELPTIADMAGVFTRLVRDEDFTIMAADDACNQLYDAIVARETADLDADLLTVGSAA